MITGRAASPTEPLVENVAAFYFGVIGAATKRGGARDHAQGPPQPRPASAQSTCRATPSKTWCAASRARCHDLLLHPHYLHNALR